MDFPQFHAMTQAEKQKEVMKLYEQAFKFLCESARPLRATVKQICTAKLDSRSRDLLDACFPDFRGQQEVSDWFAGGGVEWEITSTGTKPTTKGRLRRFAGDNSLEGGRYYSVCRDDNGNDGGPPLLSQPTVPSPSPEDTPGPPPPPSCAGCPGHALPHDALL